MKPRSRVRRAVAWAGVAALSAATLLLVGWYLDGGRWVRVETPSMGTQAPVGTLLWVKPTAFEDLRVGDFITFRPPGHPPGRPSGAATTYSHLVAAVHDDGTVDTQGRISARDPWRLGPEDVVGRVAMSWPGVGWLVQAAPVLGLGALLVGSVVGRLRDRDSRVPVALIGTAVVLAAVLVVYRPLTGAEQLSFRAVEGGARASYVSTGLLPVQLTEPGGDRVVLAAGEVGSVLSTSADGRRFEVSVRPAIPTAWWWVLVGACFVPAIATARPRRVRLVGLRRIAG